MIKNTFLRLLIIPLPGILISFVSGVITYDKYSVMQIIGAISYFVIVSFCIWLGCRYIHIKLRRLYSIKKNPFSKISLVCLISALYSSAVSGIFCFVWLRYSKEEFRWAPISRFISLSVLAVIVITLVYEILYLSKEREFDTKIVNQLDHDLNRAEMMALRNTLDPHFIYNSLNTLSHLISVNSKKADLFNTKLAQVYKYFLLNKSEEAISANKEFEFIKNYFALLQIRHGNELELHINLDAEDIKGILIIPCALQILVENVIKHNDLSSDSPLNIFIKTDNDYLIIENEISRKKSIYNSTRTGLKNLADQYLLVFNKNIVVKECENTFMVKLPLIKNFKTVYV